MVGQCRTSVFEVGKQCHDCEAEQGDDSLIFRYLQGLPIGDSSTGFMCTEFGGNPWRLTIEFLKPGIDHFAGKFNGALDDVSNGRTRQLEPHLDAMRENWLLFCLYATCMLEGCMGLSPFRYERHEPPNACQVIRKEE